MTMHKEELRCKRITFKCEECGVEESFSFHFEDTEELVDYGSFRLMWRRLPVHSWNTNDVYVCSEEHARAYLGRIADGAYGK